MSLTRHIPNAVTSVNLLCGVLGVTAAFNGRPDLAFILMIVAAAFDYCDGFVARMLGANSDFGKELDSLSDAVSFGVLPSVMLFNAMKGLGCGAVWCYVPLILAIMSAVRLAKFNIDPRQHESFIGLPTPPSAMMCGALCSFLYSSPDSCLAAFCSHDWVLPLLAVVLSFLLVSEIPMFALKLGKNHKKADSGTVCRRYIFLAAALISVAVIIAFGLNWTLSVFLAFAAYIVINFFPQKA